MTFKKGQAKIPGSGRKRGVVNKVAFDVKAALRMRGPELSAELGRIALTARNEATRVMAIRECFDRMLGKASQPIEGQVLYGVSAELQRLLEQHDGLSRSVPSRTNGALIEHDASDDETNG